MMSATLARILAGSLLLVGCAPGDLPVGEGDCADEAHVAEHCDDTHCGAPEVEVGTGADRFVDVEEGDPIDIVRGVQGGYHLDVAARMSELCPVVYLRASVWLDPGDGGDLEPVFDGERHLQAVRPEPEGSTLQEAWGVRAFVPCEHWPDTGLQCSGGAGSEGHLEDYEVVLRVEVEDHDGRMGTSEQRLQPVCCEG